jgi:hypothetical protein
MKDMNLTEIFCEVLGGLGLAFVLVPALDLTHVYRMNVLFPELLAKLDWAVLGSILVLAYLAGAVIDALGLAAEELFLGKFITSDKLSKDEVEAFWKNGQEHALKYRDQQWAWYSCYRNLFLLFVPGALLWTWVVVDRYTWCRGILVFSGFVLLEGCFVVTMKALVKIYYQVSRSV